MQKGKYGIWKTRYAQNSRNIYEGWLLKNRQPLLFGLEQGALEHKHHLELMPNNFTTEYEVRRYPL